jgi:hypothetical protein
MSLLKAALPDDPDKLREFAILLQAELYNKTLYIEKLKAQLYLLNPPVACMDVASVMLADTKS